MADPDWMSRPLRIATPENVWFTYGVAGPGVRFAAWLIDAGVIAIATIALAVPLGMIMAMFRGWGTLVMTTLLFVLWQGYFLAFEAAMHGQTIGKRAMGIRVMDERGFRVTFAQSA